MIGLDSNVLVRHLAQDDPEQSRLAGDLLGTLTEDEPGFVGLVALTELIWVLGSRYGLSKQVVLRHVEDLLAARELEFEDGETVWRALLQAQAGADFADAVIADTAELFGCSETVTFDRRAADKLGMRLLS